MNIETLKMFRELAELKSFSKTADKLTLSQSAISQQLAQLELMFDCQLVNRKKRPIELTKQGQLLYKASKDMMDRFESLKSDLAALKSSASSQINIAAVYTIGMYSLSVYVKKFMIKYPHVKANVEYCSSDKVYEMVFENIADIGLVACPARDKRLNVQSFMDEPLVLVCNPHHPLASKSTIDIHKVQFEKFIAFDPGVPTRLFMDDLLKRYNIVIHPVMEFDNIETIKRAIEINIGISILPFPTVAKEVETGTLTAISFSNENFIRPTGIITLKSRKQSQFVRFLINLLRQENSQDNIDG